jgi:hypothetical protein
VFAAKEGLLGVGLAAGHALAFRRVGDTEFGGGVMCGGGVRAGRSYLMILA